MSTFVIVLRAASLLAFAGPILLTVGGRGRKRSRDADRRSGDQTPVVANFAAFGLFFAFLGTFAGDAEGPTALVLALCGCLLAVALPPRLYFPRLRRPLCGARVRRKDC